jgi:hypothetical protein
LYNEALDGKRMPQHEPALRAELSAHSGPSPLPVTPKGEVGGRRAEVGGRRSEVGGRRSEVGGRRSEVGGRRSEVGGRRAEVGGRRAEVGGRRAEVGGQRSEVGPPPSALRPPTSDAVALNVPQSAPVANTDGLNAQAVACLRAAAVAWSGGNPNDPEPAAIWRQLRDLIKRRRSEVRSRRSETGPPTSDL